MPIKTLKPSIGYLPRQHTVLDTQGETARTARLPWRKWYKTQRWRALRWQVLRRDRFTCRMCGAIAQDSAQLVADHIQPHRGDPVLFWNEANLQCLCAPCHNSEKQKMEAATRGPQG